MRRASNVDSNQAAIVAALRKCGVSVQHLHKVGDGCPDILCGWRGVNALLEIKSVRTPTKKSQTDWHASWNGQVAIVHNFKEAMDAILTAAKLPTVSEMPKAAFETRGLLRGNYSKQERTA